MASEVELRLKERHELRKAALEEKRKEKAKDVSEEETSDYFRKQFSRQQEFIETSLQSMTSSTSTEDLKDGFDQVVTEMKSLRKLLSDSTSFLPYYTIRTFQQKLSDLQQSINTKQDELLPKQKFSFKSRKKTQAKDSKLDSRPFGTEEQDSSKIKLTDDRVVSSSSKGKTDLKSNTFEVNGKFNDFIILESDRVNSCDINLTDLTSCVICIIGTPGTVHISTSKDCRLLCGPVQRSVFVEDCSNCTFVVACQQLRVHTTKDSIFYLHVTSRGIIEDSTGLQFAPFNWTYPQIEDHFSESGLSSIVNNWDTIDDFNWLTSKEHSPNWSILPESERKISWDYPQ